MVVLMQTLNVYFTPGCLSLVSQILLLLAVFRAVISFMFEISNYVTIIYFITHKCITIVKH